MKFKLFLFSKFNTLFSFFPENVKKVKSLLNIICDLKEKTNLLIWSLVFSGELFKMQVKMIF